MISPVHVFCDAHESYVGSPHPPRCAECERLSAEYNNLPPVVRDRTHAIPEPIGVRRVA